ncbi:MAG: response regulator transcription factor [Fimbriimonas sp.]
MVRTVVVARYATVRAGLRTMLTDAVGVTVIGEAAGSVDLLPLAALRPDAVVVELDAADAPAVLDAAVAQGLAVVALGDGETGLELLANRDLPGWGYLTRGADGAELAAAVRAATAGLVVMERGLMSFVAPPEATGTDDSLSAREREVLQLIAEGLPNKQIALRLGISPHTAKFHVAGVLQKLGAASRTEAVSAGLRRGLVTL